MQLELIFILGSYIFGMINLIKWFSVCARLKKY